MLHRVIIATCVAVAFSGSAAAEEFFDFGRIPGVADEPNVEVDLNAALLAFVTEAAKTSDANVADAISGLDSVRAPAVCCAATHFDDWAALRLAGATKGMVRSPWSNNPGAFTRFNSRQ